MKKKAENKDLTKNDENKINKLDVNSLKLIISPELISQFVDEANEILNSVEQNLLVLEKESSTGEIISSIFRSLHTLKGNAGFMEYTDIVAVCHKAESFMDILRSGTTQINSEQISLLLKVVDSLRKALENLTKDRPPLIAGKIGLINLMDIIFGLNKTEDKEPISEKGKNKEGNDNNKKNESTNSSKSNSSKTITNTEKVNKSNQTTSTNETSEFIRVDVKKLNRLMDLVGEIVISESMISQHSEIQFIESPGLEKSIRNHQKNVSELQEIATSMRMIPLTGLFNKMQRLVRDISEKENKKVDLVITGSDTEVDRSIIEHISAPLVHLLRNAIDHGIETEQERKKKGKSIVSKLILSASRIGGEIWIKIKDDGSGLDHDRILAKAIEKGLLSKKENNISDEKVWNLIFTPGFSTSDTITDISGRGVGLDVVHRNIEEIRGRVDVESTEDKGTTFTLKIPLTTAIINGMLLRINNSLYAIPTQDIKESVHVTKSGMIDLVDGTEVLHIRDKLIPIIRLQELHNIEGNGNEWDEGVAVVAENIGKEIGFMVDEIIGQQQLVIKPLSKYTGNIPGVSGCSILGNGDICLILDLSGLVKIVESNKDSASISKNIFGKLTLSEEH